MNKVKTQFSIKDLENLSGIKAHTIRIWEKRYDIFEPIRSETNIRTYSNDDLLKILNISFLNDYGYKISRIAKMQETEISEFINQIVATNSNVNFALNKFKVAMINFDTNLFNTTYTELSKTKKFSEIFIEIFIPLLQEIGILWQTNSIKPIHEHFISYLIYQKTVEKTAKAQQKIKQDEGDATYVLFLPENEVHEISLLFVNYQLISKGCKTLYLGSSVSISDLQELKNYYEAIIFISHFTVKPHCDVIDSYVEEFSKSILSSTKNSLYVSGNQALKISTKNEKIKIFDNVKELIEFL